LLELDANCKTRDLSHGRVEECGHEGETRTVSVFSFTIYIYIYKVDFLHVVIWITS